MSSQYSIESVTESYKKEAHAAISELCRQLAVALAHRECMGDISELKHIVAEYKSANSLNNQTLGLLSGISANTISKMLKDPTTSKVDTVQSLLDTMGMTLSISRKPNDE